MATATCSLSLAGEEQHHFGNQTPGCLSTALSVFTDPATSLLCPGQREEQEGSQGEDGCGTAEAERESDVLL